MTITELVSKFARRMNEQLLKTSGAGVSSSRKKTPKNLREVASTHITPHKRKRLIDNMWTSWETHYSRGKACSVNNSLREWVASSVQHMWPMLQVIGSWLQTSPKILTENFCLSALMIAELSRAWSARSGAPWVRKSIHPRKFGNNETVDRPSDRPSAPKAYQCK